VNDFYPQCSVEPSEYALGLQTAPWVKIIHFTPSVHNILLISVNGTVKIAKIILLR
jgi:hypothetical protein